MMGMDGEILVWINQQWASPVADTLFTWLSAKVGFSFPLLAIIAMFLGVRHGANGWRCAALFLALVATSDLLGNLLKHWLAMPRPCLDYALQLRGIGGAPFENCATSDNGMPSNHALNFFTAFGFLAYVQRHRAWTIGMLFVAAAVGLSRIYLGAHFPSQVLVGAVLGVTFGVTTAYIAARRWQFVRTVRGMG